MEKKLACTRKSVLSGHVVSLHLLTVFPCRLSLEFSVLN